MRKSLAAFIALLLVAAPAWADSSGAVQPGNAGTRSDLAGGIFTAAGITLTDGQQAALQIDSTGHLLVTSTGGGGGGGGGAVTVADGADVALGTTTDTAYAGSGSSTLVAALKGIYSRLSSIVTNTTSIATSALQTTGNTSLATIATNTTGASTSANQSTEITAINAVTTAVNNSAITAPLAVTGNTGSDGSSTITTGGTPQNLFAGATPVNAFEVCNPDVTDLWISQSTTAGANASGSIRVAANGGCYDSPALIKPFHAISIVGATTGQKFTAIKG